MAYRSTIHESTGCSPNLLMLNREIAMPIDIVAGNPLVHTDTECQIQYIEWLSHIMQKTHEFAFQNLERSAQTQKRNYDKGLKPRTVLYGDGTRQR